MDNSTPLAELKTAVRTFCQKRNWDQFHGAKDLAIGLVTEASELLEIFRFQNDKQIAEILQDDTQRQAVADELADTLFFLLRFADRFNFDLTQSFREKMAKNDRKYPEDKFFGSNKKATS